MEPAYRFVQNIISLKISNVIFVWHLAKNVLQLTVVCLVFTLTPYLEQLA
jgi:hypothetical protein